MALSWTLDHVGPMTRSAQDAALALAVMAGHDPRDPTSATAPCGDYVGALASGIDGLRLGVPCEFFFDQCHPEIEAATRDAAAILADHGAKLVDVPFPATRVVDLHAIELLIISAEMASLHGGSYDAQAPYGDEFRRLLIRAQFTTATDYLHALRARHLVQLDFEQAFEQVDAIVAPAVLYATPRLDRLVADLGGHERPLADVVARTTAVFNIAGIPTVTIPAGFGSDGMPIGIELAARPYAEELCLRFAHAFQQLTDHHRQVPPLVAGWRDGPDEEAAVPSGTICYPVVNVAKDRLW
jgi:Asp-tRNA(Asn)/Glu-tRNA(Gln) amidotransferase A subunit family amidase